MIRLTWRKMLITGAISIIPFSQGVAALVPAYFSQQAAGLCQGALLQFAGSLRARPLALQNEGSATAFVTCAFPNSDFGEGANEGGLTLTFVNQSAEVKQIACTLVGEWGTASEVAYPIYLPKNVLIAGNSTSVITWVPSDYEDGSLTVGGGEETLSRAAISCALPSGTGVETAWMSYSREIGN